MICFDNIFSINIVNFILSLRFLLIISGDIKTNPGPEQSSIKICHSNIRSLNEGKLDHINFDLCPYYDIICLTETNLHKQRSLDFELNLPGFQDPYRKDRLDRQGGGVAVYVSDNIGAIRKFEFENQNLEAIWLEIKCLHNKMFYLCVCYRPPNSSAEFWNLLNESIYNVKDLGIKNILIAGDLNADPNSRQWVNLKSVTESNNLEIHIKEPTRITSTSETILDQFISNMEDRVKNISVFEPIATTDHSTISVELLFGIIRKKTFSRLIWNYAKANYTKFHEKLQSAPWDDCFVANNVHTAAESWTDMFLNIAGDCIPNKIVKIYPNDKPFYTSALRTQKKKVTKSKKNSFEIKI